MSTPRRSGTWRIARVVGVDVLIKPSLVLMGAFLVVLFARGGIGGWLGVKS